ncbi:MAG TPA: hypothetical protein VGS57_18255 [Thermoanaerobaculia bacterium]|jgi:hypothetical protein|nr:hypothetical protein [Thermoanaerobaculia bacterium]
MRRAATGFLLALLVIPAAARAQLDWASFAGRPSDDWRTLEVPGYRLYYPAPAEPWARHLAARLPAVRERVAAQVGWDAKDTVDVVLADPIAQPNGAAWPLLHHPRLVLLLTPPNASSQLGQFGDWPQLLITHEQAHLSHLLRPSRNPLVRALRLPFGPIALRAPRWVSEGYATIVEGRATRSGRPSSPLRAAVLRRWAQRGRLPAYPALAGDSRTYLGDAMAYLAGSAYLEWLEARTDPGSLDRLWRRLTARKVRPFAGAFRGVFGESPQALWDRFRAELSWQSVEVEKRLGSGGRDGEPWLDRTWGTGRPAVSRDGARVAFGLTERDTPPRIAIYATKDDTEAEHRREEEQKELLARDPEDAPAVKSGAPERDAVATLELPGTTVDPSPRFLGDGSVLFARSLPDGDGRFRADLFHWRPDGGDVERLTHEADLRAADPSPDGGFAVAVEARWGQTRLVRVDLGSGEVTPLTEASVDVVVDSPRISPDGARLAYLRHRAEGWELVIRELASGEERIVATPPGAAVQDPAWSPRGDTLYAVVEQDGVLDVRRLALPSAADDGSAGGDAPHATPSPQRITRVLGAALGPEPLPDESALLFLSLEPEGMQVRRIALGADGAGAAADTATTGAATADASASTTALDSASPSASTPRALDAAELHPALPPTPTAPPALALAEVPPSRDYGFGRGEWSQLSGGSAGPGAASAESGIRGGDLVGKWELLALVAVGTGAGARGASAAAAWRGWPVELVAQAYRVKERPSAQRDAEREAGRLFDLTTKGAELTAGWERPLLEGRLGARLAVGTESLDTAGGGELSRHGVQLETTAAKQLRRGPWRLATEIGLGGALASTEGESWNRRGGRLALTLGRTRSSLQLAFAKQDLGGRPAAVDLLRVGGLPSTLLPPFAGGNRIEVPALPAAALVGSGYEGQRVALDLPRGPLTPFWERHRVERAHPGLQQNRWSDWVGLAGAELELRLPPLPLFDLAAARLHVGAAYGLDEPYRGDVQGWAVLAWRP